MALLILNRRALLDRLPAWLGELDSDLVIITARSALRNAAERSLKAYREVIAVDDYEGEGVERCITEIARKHSVKRIVSSAEIDVLRAARAREECQLPGQSVESALCYRDKFLMKSRLAEAGISVATMRIIHDGAELRSFADQSGLPLVVKPRRGGGSVGVRVLTDQRSLAALEEELGPGNWDLLAEEWIDGAFYTVDGLMRRGQVLQCWPSRTTANLDAATGASSLLSWMVPLSDVPLAERIQALVSDVVAALPPVHETTALHAEVFHTVDGRFILCEIACRPGGCGHVGVYEHALGLNLYEASLRGQAGCENDWSDLTRNPRASAGFVWCPPKKGVLSRLPLSCPVPGTLRYTPTGVEGARYEGPKSVADNVAQVFASGPPSTSAEPIVRAIDRWWSDACGWRASDGQGEPPPDRTATLRDISS